MNALAELVTAHQADKFKFKRSGRDFGM